MGDFNPSAYEDKFMSKLVEFVSSHSFQALFENYFLSHAHEFQLKKTEEEHNLRYYELYNEFKLMFEHQLEDFCKIQEITVAE